MNNNGEKNARYEGFCVNDEVNIPGFMDTETLKKKQAQEAEERKARQKKRMEEKKMEQDKKKEEAVSKFKNIKVPAEKADWEVLQELDELVGQIMSNDKEPTQVSIRYRIKTSNGAKKQTTRGKISTIGDK